MAECTKGGQLYGAECVEGHGTKKFLKILGWLNLLGGKLAAECCKGPWYPKALEKLRKGGLHSSRATCKSDPYRDSYLFGSGCPLLVMVCVKNTLI